jgi:hypothetical protein
VRLLQAPAPKCALGPPAHALLLLLLLLLLWCLQAWGLA